MVLSGERHDLAFVQSIYKKLGAIEIILNEDVYLRRAWACVAHVFVKFSKSSVLGCPVT
jgi:hypothetical protein